MKVKIWSIFKEFAKRHKIFTYISLFILFENTIIGCRFKFIALDNNMDVMDCYIGLILGSSNPIGFIYGIFKLIINTIAHGASKELNINFYILITSMYTAIYAICIFPIAIKYMSKIIDEMIIEEDIKDYKIKCYLIYIFICFILKLIDNLVFRFLIIGEPLC